MTEFIAGRPEVVSLLGGDWREDDARAAVGERRVLFKRDPGLGNALRDGYGDIWIPDAVNRNLDALNQSDTLAVVTGQQVGILSGPLYTFYKAFTAVLLAQRLEKETSGRVVPIFWMETSDADFSEVNRINFPAGKDISRNQIYAPQEIVPGRSVNFHELTGEIDEVCDNVVGWLEDLLHRDLIADLVRRSYYPGRLMPEAFMELMTGLFGSMGLVMINPLHGAVVARSVDFWNRSLQKPDKLNKSFLIASSELTRLRFPLQVRLRDDALPILYIGNSGVRRRIRGQPGAWKVSHDKTEHNDEQLRAMAVENPGAFTPSALLRPVLQDWLLPTWIYLGGPSEVAYHAQIGRCYDLLDIPRPLIAPRMSVTIVEPTARRLLDRNNWTVKDAIGGREILLRSSGKPAVLADLLDRGFEQLESWIERIEQTAEEAEVSISSEIDKISRKLKYQWEKLERITLNRIAERDRVRVDHSDRILSMLMPDGLLQERHDNVLYYLAVYGNKLTRIISEEADLFQSQHLVVDLEAE